jgi:hypothetical protein
MGSYILDRFASIFSRYFFLTVFLSSYSLGDGILELAFANALFFCSKHFRNLSGNQSSEIS